MRTLNLICAVGEAPIFRGALTYNRKEKITAIEPGPAFDAIKWRWSSEEIENSILGGPLKVGRDYSLRVSSVRFVARRAFRGANSSAAWWCAAGTRRKSGSSVHSWVLDKSEQLLAADHYRRIREHRNLTLLLNLLLAGRTSLQPLQPEHFWARVLGDDESTGNYQCALSRGFFSGVTKRWFGTWSGKNLRPRDAQSPEIKWVQQSYFANLGEIVIDQLSPPAGEKLEELEPEEYFANVGYDGKGLRVPADLDNSICLI
jgi:hypothetical protein